MTATTKTRKADRRKHCRICRQKTPHYYIGLQALASRRLKLYNCSVCHGTTSEEEK